MPRLIQLTLPWPPSANTYWRRNGNCYFISKKGIDYRKTVGFECLVHKGRFDENTRIKLSVNAYPPDKRKRDLDNLFKGLLDSLQHACVFPDDNQIDELSIKRMPERKGKVIVTIERIEQCI